MTVKFNFFKLENIYQEALSSNDKSMTFESKIGKGRFLFMMFLSDEDLDAKDNLFIYLRNTNEMIRIKLYGNHLKGTFTAYINNFKKEKLIRELELQHRGNVEFDFIKFLEELNDSIPLTISSKEKLDQLRKDRDVIKKLNVIDESDKTVLLCEKRLPHGKSPQDKTLRKLYMYTNSNAEDIGKLIDLLKRFNMTVCWTTEDRRKCKRYKLYHSYYREMRPFNTADNTLISALSC